MTTLRFFFLAALVFSATNSYSAAVPLNSSVLLFNEWDYNRCPELMQNAIDLGNKTVNIVPSLGYQTDRYGNLIAFCLSREDYFCHKLTQPLANFISQKIAECLQVAEAAQVNISFVPHLDYAFRSKDMPEEGMVPGKIPPGAGGTGDYPQKWEASFWRNFAVFDPLKRYYGFSYEEAFLRPLLDGAEGILAKGGTVQLALQGEMGATTFKYPQSFASIIRFYKSRADNSRLQVGISLNHNKINGQIWGYSKPQVQELFNAADFIGMSAYRSVSVLPKPQDFQAIVRAFVDELRGLGISQDPSKPVHFSEISVGGGDYWQTGRIAGSVAEIADAPWSGVGGPYTEARDPWKKPEYAAFRRQYFQALLGFLANPSPQYPVTAAYLWNTSSWDVQGIYSKERHYSDDSVIDLIRVHNRK